MPRHAAGRRGEDVCERVFRGVQGMACGMQFFLRSRRSAVRVQELKARHRSDLALPREGLLRARYGDGCEQIATRKPGLDPPHQQPVTESARACSYILSKKGVQFWLLMFWLFTFWLLTVPSPSIHRIVSKSVI